MRFYTSMMLLTASIMMLFLTLISTSDARYLRNKPGFKQARATRGFKGAALQVGRGFGKRASEQNDFLLDLDDNGLSEIDGMTERYYDLYFYLARCNFFIFLVFLWNGWLIKWRIIHHSLDPCCENLSISTATDSLPWKNYSDRHIENNYAIIYLIFFSDLLRLY